METFFRAVLCGLFGGIFSPICFLGTVLSGGMAVGIEHNVQQRPIPFKETLWIGLYCGMSAGTFSLIFWYGILKKTIDSFSWFFALSSGKELLENTTPILWQYGIIHFFACIPLAILGSTCSYSVQQRSNSWDF